ncbi:hypothetical protein GIB67_012746 [Kingdonia uniflora]|uniref:Uncharacterized protein n=1 Tax=Kingdonia uniflora TaxID=39325 RepID=A0A7J7NF28_9MAGN|nr:hypothetical protein GIB67_012746 [Kingdonia uniflora]
MSSGSDGGSSNGGSLTQFQLENVNYPGYEDDLKYGENFQEDGKEDINYGGCLFDRVRSHLIRFWLFDLDSC